jgi:hypothetical protein
MGMWQVALTLLILAGLFSLYSAISFWLIQDISTPTQLPRMRYSMIFWGATFLASVIGTIALFLTHRKKPNGAKPRGFSVISPPKTK